MDGDLVVLEPEAYEQWLAESEGNTTETPRPE
jgi:hypothetical protein